MEAIRSAVLDMLTNARSENPDLIKLAEQQLASFEVQPGFYLVLSDIILDRTMDLNLRFLASVCLKKGVYQYWSQPVLNVITREEKEVIKNKLFLYFDEPADMIAAIVADVISKIAGLDWPSDWPELFPSIMDIVQRPEDIYQHRGLLILHRIVKTLASECLSNHEEVTNKVFPTILHLWINYSNAFLKGEAVHNNHKLLLEKCLYCLKVLKEFAVHGFTEPSLEPDVVNFISNIFEQFKPFIECRRYMLSLNQEELIETCEKYIVYLVKVLSGILEKRTVAFSQFVTLTLECAFTFCFTEEYAAVMFERFTVGLLNIMRTIVSCKEPVSRTSGRSMLHVGMMLPDYVISSECREKRQEFFTSPILQEIVKHLVSRYFLLTENDIKSWAEDPEEFSIEEWNRSGKINLKPCATDLYFALSSDYFQILHCSLMPGIKELEGSKATDFTSLLKREAVFYATGLIVQHSFGFNDLEFENFFIHVLVPELQIKEKNYHIIHRRVLWVIDKRVDRNHFSMVPLFCNIVIQFLDSKENLLVRLAAMNALKSVDTRFGSTRKQVLPYAETIFNQLFFLLKDIEGCELKIVVLQNIANLIMMVKRKLYLHVVTLAEYLIELWKASGNHMLLQCAIISCFVQIVDCLESASEKLLSVLLPMIALSIDVSRPHHVYLLDDGLILWQNVLHHTSTCSPELLDLAKYLTAILGSNCGIFDKCLDVIESYVFLKSLDFLQRYGADIVSTSIYVVTDLFPESCSDFIKVIESILKVFPVEAPNLVKPALMVALSKILEEKVSSKEPNVTPPICALKLTYKNIRNSQYFSALERVVLHNPNLFENLLQKKALECGLEVDEVYSNLLDVWLETAEEKRCMDKSKLSSLAFASLLTSGSSIIHQKFSKLVFCIIQTLNQLSGYYYGTSCNDKLVADNQEWAEDDMINKFNGIATKNNCDEQEKRVAEFDHKDIVNTVVLKFYFKSQLTALKYFIGDSKYEELMSTVDSEVMEQLQRYLTE